MRDHIKQVLKFHYELDATNKEICQIDQALRSQYSALHDQRIIREIVHRRISEILLKHRSKENVLELEDLFMRKLIFNYLTYASMSYRAGIPIATIYLSRTALEAGLREKIAEKKAAKTVQLKKDYQKEVWNEMKKLERRAPTLQRVIEIAEKEGIMKEVEIEQFFTIDEKGKPVLGKHRRLLDKYIHADLPTLVDFFEKIGLDTRVRGCKDLMQEKKIIAESFMEEVAVIILAATTRLAERLYLSHFDRV